MFKVMTWAILAASSVAMAGGPNIIFDTDMVSDYDDVGAVACLHAMADQGECRILAMGTSTGDNASVGAVEVLNAFYGRPEIPVGGCPNAPVGPYGPHGEPAHHRKYVNLVKAYPDWAKHPNSSNAPNAVAVYRKALASAPDRSVVFCSVGFMTNMRRLLESKGDEQCRLNGRDLVAKKVRSWHAMACKFPNRSEYNSSGDAESSRIAFEQWPTPIVFSDFNYGVDVFSGRTVSERDYGYPNPVKDIFRACLPSREACRDSKRWHTPEGHSSWDEVTVLAAVRCDCEILARGRCRYFNLERGTYRMFPNGEDAWVPDPKSRNFRLVEAVGREHGDYPKWTIGRILDELIARPPKCRRTDATITAVRRCALEKTASGVRMMRDGKTLWNFEIDTPEGRPFFHPLCLPSGKALTDCRPKDHVWHLGFWFSWKFIDGVNYWEPADEKRTGHEPAGETRVTKRNVAADGLDCTISLELAYAPRGAKSPTLVEKRKIVVDPPDPNGGYSITVNHEFTAKRACTLDRTPPHGSTDIGAWGGGYAGATLRLDPAEAAAFSVRGFERGDGAASVTGRETKFVELTDPATGEGVRFTQLKAPPTGKFYVWPDKRFVNASALYDGPIILRAGEKLSLAYRLAVRADGRVRGVLAARPVEKLDRGLVAALTERGTYLSWRLLDSDSPDRGFDVWRKAEGKVEKLTDSPIVQTTDFDLPGCKNRAAQYSLDGVNFTPVTAFAAGGRPPVRRIALANTNDAPAQIGFGDLDGDGRYDLVIKTPAGGTDPWDLVYKPAARTCRLEAYSHDGTFLWSRDHGWNIEMGAWYSPYLVVDMDGDGKAEVVSKTAPTSPDCRDADGRVQRGPEFLSVLNGLTGETIAQTPWPERAAPDPVRDYNHYASRNQIALAYLDGKTPCVIVERGTYGKMVVEAHCLRGGRLERLWRFDNEFLPRRHRGQGDHACLCHDVDGDGCDEVLIGSLCLDQDGTILWCTGRGHSDAHYFGDIDPVRPGMELFYVYEAAQPDGGGLFMCDPATGEEIWKLPASTRHVHSCGMCSDLAPEHAGLEVYGQETDQGASKRGMTHPASSRRWFYAADGRLVAAFENCAFGYSFGVKSLWWDGDLQREVHQRQIADHNGVDVSARGRGDPFILDFDGDWREEKVAGCRGEILIYSTDIPALDRRVTLMRDPVYRSRVMMESSGYSQCPILSYVPSAVSPNLSLRIDKSWRTMRIDVTAPLNAPLKGTLALGPPPKDWKVAFPPTPIDLKPGEIFTRTLKLEHPKKLRGRYDFTLTLSRPNRPPLVLRQPQCAF